MLTDQSQDERFEEFLQHFLQDQAHIFSYVRSLLPRYADAQDVFQRCSLTLWRQFDQFDQQRLFLPWACTIALNEVRNFRRVSGRDKLQLADDLVEQLAERRRDTLAHRERRSLALRTCVESLKQSIETWSSLFTKIRDLLKRLQSRQVKQCKPFTTVSRYDAASY